MLWSDHGWHLGEKLITGKNTLWDRSTRVPLIFAGPGVTAGARSRRPAELLDIYPTLVELAGLPENGRLEGLSLVPQLQDAEAPRDRPAITTHNHDNHGVRSERLALHPLRRRLRGALRHARRTPTSGTTSPGTRRWRRSSRSTGSGCLRSSAKPAPGSRHRILTYEDGVATWEGEEIGPQDPVPEI